MTRQVRGLLQFPRQVRAEPRSNAQRGVDEPCRLRVPDDRVRDGAQGTRQWQHQAVEEPIHHVEGDHVRDARAVGGHARDEVAAKGDAERGRAGHPEVIQDRVRRVLPLGLEGHARQHRRCLRAVRRVRLPTHRGELPAAIGDRVLGESEASVGLVESA